MPKKKNPVVQPVGAPSVPVESPKKVVRFEDFNFDSLVNETKAKRAFSAVFGGAKPQSNEVILAGKLRGQGFEGEELVVEIYKGLGGLVDSERAAINRVNEKKSAKVRASR